MTSAKNPHSSNLQQNPTAAAANMTNTNDEPTTSQNHQQQELIRLLAQHFNNQLANRATTISETPLPLPLLHSGSTNNNFQSTLAHYQQQQQLNTNHQQYRLGQDAINFSTRNRALNLEQQQRQMSPTYLGAGGNQRTIRSQPSTLANMNPICLTNPVINTRPSPASLPMVQQQHPTVNCNPFMPDMSIFNALNCFGLPNDQFVLSLQQQYLIQAANAARQLESRLAAEHGDMNGNMNSKIEPTSHETNRQNQQHLSSGKCSTGSSNMAELGSEITSNQSGRELLKFSINTILGRGSPLPANMTGQPTAIDDLRSRTPPSMNPFFNDQSGFLIGNKKFAPDGHHNHHEAQANSNERQQISPDCDPDAMTDVDSEPSPAPNQQQSSNNNNNNSSRLANPEHSQSASSSTTNQQGITSHGMTITGNESQHSAAAAGHQHPSLFLAGPTAFPWTVASRGKPRRGMMRRAVFSDSQRVGLEKRFQLQKYISKQDRKKLADKLGLRDSQVKIWFQNRRMKWRNSKERELLSAGGSREQTLPTRNNPNPDLSDVGETFKRLVSGGTNNIGTA